VTNDPLYLAIDLGAGSGRGFLACLEPARLILEEVRRFNYLPTQSNGHLRWDFQTIFNEVKAGLLEAGRLAREPGKPIRSIGVDSWGVDYGLIDAEGKLIEDPVCYRDPRTHDVMNEVFTKTPRKEIFQRTGIQSLEFNTLFQLYAHDKAGIPESATKLLMIPDLINLFLTGRAVTEYTNATTTQMLNAKTRNWDRELIERLGLPARLLQELVHAGTELGLMDPPLAHELNLQGVRVVAPATHDTASAVAGTPLEDGWAYISSGTWSLVGIERAEPLICEEVARQNLTNEGGVFGTTRFLKNVMGLWILESCRKEWVQQGLNLDYDSLLTEVASIEGCGPVIFPDDQRFFNPPSMIDAIFEQLLEAGQCLERESMAPSAIAKTILDSLALRYASVLRTIESLTGRRIEGVHIVGGGSRNDYLNQATATATGLPVRAGPVEATVIGNVVVQAIAAGRFESLAEARKYVGEQERLKTYEPVPSQALADGARRYKETERRYLEHEYSND